MTPQTATPAGRERISVCVCTYRRPVLLRRLLEALITQRTDGAFDVDVVVVDNDADASSRGLVGEIAALSPMPVTYSVQPLRNISLTRNAAVSQATGALVAFIDDDEQPGADWLLLLYRTLTASRADGVLAPVVPEFTPDAPHWLRTGQFLQRRRLATGSRIGEADGRTGNALLKRTLFPDGQTWFDPAFGRTGGEDSDFFARHLRAGAVIVWCDEAAVVEAVPPDRWRASFHIRRLWRSGTIAGEWMRTGRRRSASIPRYAVGLVACTVALPATVVLPKATRVRVAQKAAYFAGAITAYAGLSLLRDRE